MMGKTHLAGGLAFGMLTQDALHLMTPYLPATWPFMLANLSPGQVLGAICGLALGSLLPDLDEPNAMVSNLPKKGQGVLHKIFPKEGLWGGVHLGLSILLWLLNHVTRALSGMIKSVLGHRGATHWLVISPLVGLLFAFLGSLFDFPWLGWWVWLGYLSHILLDACTISGLEQPPFGKLHLLPPNLRVRTGSVVDTAISFICLVFVSTHVFTLADFDQLRFLFDDWSVWVLEWKSHLSF